MGRAPVSNEAKGILEKISDIMKYDDLKIEHRETIVKALEDDIERMLKMFYLHMKVKGHLKDFKEDYFM